nr:uncharacterized protein CFP56_09854 [Quercus suber]
MHGVLVNGAGERKRKRAVYPTQGKDSSASRKAPRTSDTARTNGVSVQAQILLLEEQILVSREHYNNVVKLLELVENVQEKPKKATLAAVALCRVFTRLIAGEKLVLRRNDAEAEVEVARWLKDRLRDYTGHLLSWIGSPDAVQEKTAITLLMRIVKSETTQDSKRSEQAWRQGSTFPAVIRTLVEVADADGARQEFVEKYVEEYDDVRFYTFVAIKQSFVSEQPVRQESIANILQLLCLIEGVPESANQLEDWYGEAPATETNQLCSLNAHRRTAQDAWLATFRSGLTKDHRKKILSIMTSQVLPWFVSRIELLADFMTDSFNEGGSLSLLALSGIFHLMTKQNLDYPDFYTKLYSLLDENIMHNKHRSRFFRLFDNFLNSSHLPAAMIASFIKRLARLSLQAPPGAIVWVVPWVYNMLKQHPACTFMLHRSPHPAHAIYASHPNYAEDGMHDLYAMAEPDPMLTNALESSLWELETLRSHYHPNVATLAKILGEQFTKREYQLEDFLDHSYAGLINGELSRKLKKAPEVEWEIPKRILTRADEEGGGLNALGGLLQNAVDCL